MTILAHGRAERSDPAAASRLSLTSRPIVRRATLIASAAAIVALDVHLISPYVSRAAAALSNPVMYWVAIALAAEIVSIVATAALQRRMLRATGTRVDKRTAVGMAYSAYAINMSLPAGPAMSAGYTFRRLRQIGATPPAAGFTLISSGVLNALSYALLAVGGFTLADGSTGGPAAVVTGLVAAGLLVFVTRSLLSHPAVLERFGGWTLRVVNRVRRREPDTGMPELRHSTSTLSSIHPRGRDWAVGLAAALINWVGDLGCLFAACQAVGASGATIGVVVLAYLGGTSVSGISLVPGGLGVVDAALIVILVHNGVATAPATAAVLLYRALSFGFGIVAGWSAWIGHASNWRHHARNETPRTTPDPIASGPSRRVSKSRCAESGRPVDARCAGRSPRSQPGHVRLPRQSRAVADRGRHAAIVRRGRTPSAVRHRRIRPRT